MHNLKQMAATLNVYQEYGFTSPEQLEAAVDTAYQEMRQTSGELKALETKLQGKKELQRQVDEIEQLVSKKSGLYNTYHEQKQRYAELQTVKRNIDQILRREEPRRRKEQSHER